MHSRSGARDRIVLAGVPMKGLNPASRILRGIIMAGIVVGVAKMNFAFGDRLPGGYLAHVLAAALLVGLIAYVLFRFPRRRNPNKP